MNGRMEGLKEWSMVRVKKVKKKKEKGRKGTREERR